ncbi:MAG: serine/threonine protein kinase [bacterium]|nr:serine/threonine protein kinase [bacterium]
MSVDIDRLAELFDQLVGTPPTRRAAFVATVAEQDAVLADELRTLFEAHEQPDAVLDQAPEWPDELQPNAIPNDPGALEVPADAVGGAASTAARGQLTGTRLGAFRISRLIGAGSMAEVYEAEQNAPRRRVAVKVLRFAAAGTGLASRFANEVETLARLDHPNIARVLGAGAAEGDGQEGPASLSWLAMELVPDARPITDYCEERGVPRDQRVRMFVATCDAVHHAHRRGFLHRDLKPQNVVLSGSDRADPVQSVKVIDFGIARLMSREQPELDRTRHGELVGTVLYMSPEQANGAQDVLDVRSDVYSLGVLLHELLLGRHPFLRGDETVLEALGKIRNAEPMPASGSDELPTDLAAIVACALQPDPELRYDGVAALRDDLQRFLNSEPIAARPPSWLHRLRLLARRRRALCAGLAAAGLLLVIGIAVIVTLWVQAERFGRDLAKAQNEAVEQQRTLDEATTELGRVRERLAVIARDSAKGVVVASERRLEQVQRLAERRRIVSAAFDALEGLRGTLIEDADSLQSLLDAYIEVSQLHGGYWFSPKEESEVGHRALVRAKELARRLAALRPDDASQRQLWRALHSFADNCRRIGKRELGMAAADECVALARARLVDRNDDPDRTADLLSSLWTRGDLCILYDSQQGMSDARAARERALDAQQRFGAAEPRRWRYLVCWSHFRLGAWLVHVPGDVNEGLEQLRIAGDLALQLYADSGDRRTRQEMRTQLALEIDILLREDRVATARKRAFVGMKAIERHGLEDAFALSTWTRFAARVLDQVGEEERQRLAERIETLWGSRSADTLSKLHTTSTDFVVLLAERGLAESVPLQPLFRAAVAAARLEAESSPTARNQYDQLVQVLPQFR